MTTKLSEMSVQTLTDKLQSFNVQLDGNMTKLRSPHATQAGLRAALDAFMRLDNERAIIVAALESAVELAIQAIPSETMQIDIGAYALDYLTCQTVERKTGTPNVYERRILPATMTYALIDNCLYVTSIEFQNKTRSVPKFETKTAIAHTWWKRLQANTLKPRMESFYADGFDLSPDGYSTSIEFRPPT